VNKSVPERSCSNKAGTLNTWIHSLHAPIIITIKFYIAIRRVANLPVLLTFMSVVSRSSFLQASRKDTKEVSRSNGH
jgi:hypothetical protein